MGERETSGGANASCSPSSGDDACLRIITLLVVASRELGILPVRPATRLDISLRRWIFQTLYCLESGRLGVLHIKTHVPANHECNKCPSSSCDHNERSEKAPNQMHLLSSSPCRLRNRPYTALWMSQCGAASPASSSWKNSVSCRLPARVMIRLPSTILVCGYVHALHASGDVEHEKTALSSAWRAGKRLSSRWAAP